MTTDDHEEDAIDRAISNELERLDPQEQREVAAETKQEVDNDDSVVTRPEIVLTDEQTQAVETILAFVRNLDGVREFKLGGYAGTGKTTIIKTIRAALRSEGKYLARVAAFTGKAVAVLRKKGVDAQTLHSLMYNVDVDPKTNAVTFIRRPYFEDQPDLIIVDEASMVSSDLLNDLRSFGMKILWVGDPGQLEPVGDNPNLMATPDLVLEKIHRQAAESPIITFAGKVRLGCPMVHPLPDSPRREELHILSKGQISDDEATTYDQIICAKNKTRTSFNDRIRITLGRGHSHLVPGEKLIVLKNNRNFGVFNGQMFWVDEILQDESSSADCHWMVRAKDEEGQLHKLPIWKGPFFDPSIRDKKDIIVPALTKKGETVKQPGSGRGMQVVYADYGYCITCHKSQGSEWPKVLVFDEYLPPSFWDMRRWRYTAITRASEELTYLI